MNITSKKFVLAENIHFENLRHVLMFWIYSGVNKVSVIKTGGSARGSLLFFNIFTLIFGYFPHFTIFSCVEQIKKICILGRSKDCEYKFFLVIRG